MGQGGRRLWRHDVTDRWGPPVSGGRKRKGRGSGAGLARGAGPRVRFGLPAWAGRLAGRAGLAGRAVRGGGLGCSGEAGRNGLWPSGLREVQVGLGASQVLGCVGPDLGQG